MTLGSGLVLCALASGTVLVADWIIRVMIAAARSDAEVASYLRDTVGDVPRLPPEIEIPRHEWRP